MLQFNADALRRARMLKGMTQAELGAKVGLSNATICRIEKNERLPTRFEVEALMNALELPAAEINSPRLNRTALIAAATGTNRRLRVDVRLEEFFETNEKTRATGHPVTFFIPLDALASKVVADDERAEDVESDEEEIARERQR